MTADVVAEVKNALVTFETGMKAFEAFKTDIAPKIQKMDGLDAAQFTKMSEDIGKAIELSQREAGARKAIEDQTKVIQDEAKALRDKVSTLETAIARPGFGAESTKEKELALGQKRTKLFNEFARQPGQAHFDTFLEGKSVADPEIKSLTTNSDPNGGYLVMPEIGGVIKTFAYETSPVRQLATVTTIGTDSLEYVLDNDANTSGWVGELAPRTSTNTPTFGKLMIYVNELYSNPPVSQKMLDDASIDVEAWIAAKVAEEFARKEATAFVSGTGVAQPKGLLSYPSSAASTAATVAAQQIEQVVTGSATDFTYNGLVDLQNALKEAYQPNAVFMIRRATNANLMKIKDGEGRPVFNMVFDKNVGVQPTLMGQPVYFAADMPAIASNALSMIYGDIRKAYQIVDRIGIRILRDPYSNKPYINFYTTKRVGGGVVNFEAAKIGKIST